MKVMSRQVGPVVPLDQQGMIGAKHRKSEVGRALPPVNVSNRTLHLSSSKSSARRQKSEDRTVDVAAPSRSQHIKLTIPRRLHEMFYRLKASELCLLVNTWRVMPGGEENIFNLGDIAEHLPMASPEKEPQHRAALSVEHDKDEISDNCEPDRPYLLLDVRSKEQFDEYHIHSARHYETRMLRQDRLGKEIYEHKNKPNHLVIVCADGERAAVEAANAMVQKFIDNVYVLSVSVRKYLSRYTDDAEGSSPPAPEVRKTRKGPAPANLRKRKGDRVYSGAGSVHNHAYMRSGTVAQSIAARSVISTRSWR